MINNLRLQQVILLNMHLWNLSIASLICLIKANSLLGCLLTLSSNAFDTADHNILLKKLQLHGIQGNNVKEILQTGNNV